MFTYIYNDHIYMGIYHLVACLRIYTMIIFTWVNKSSFSSSGITSFNVECTDSQGPLVSITISDVNWVLIRIK